MLPLGVALLYGVFNKNNRSLNHWIEILLIFVLASQPTIMDKIKHKALLFAGATTGPNNHCMLAETPATEEFSHISPRVIISTLTKRGGVIKYVDNTSVCSVKNHIIRPADLWGEVINDANRGNHLAFLLDLPDFGNYEAGAN